MKRSEINQAIQYAKEVLEKNSWRLPEFAYWTPKQWKEMEGQLENLRTIMLGWDVTDFGSGDFLKTGAVLFTVRNGLLGDASYGTPYAEKLMILQSATGQGLPMHCHRMKTEDIINRAGGKMEMVLYGSKPDGTIDREGTVQIRRDGILHTVKAGEIITVDTGCSVTLTPGIYHSFWVAQGSGDLIAGEVSSVNDDKTDNYFVEERPRFTKIEEDEPRKYLLCNEE